MYYIYRDLLCIASLYIYQEVWSNFGPPAQLQDQDKFFRYQQFIVSPALKMLDIFLEIAPNIYLEPK